MSNNTPNQRKTRSNSNTPTFTLNDIKRLIDDAKASIINNMKHENERLYSVINSLSERIKQLEEKNNNLEVRYQQLEAADASSKSLCDESLIHESIERHRRRKFLIVAGLPEPSLGSVSERQEADSRRLKGLVSELGIQEFEPREITRIGSNIGAKPKLLRFMCKNTAQKSDILKEARKLRSNRQFGNVFILSLIHI